MDQAVTIPVSAIFDWIGAAFAVIVLPGLVWFNSRLRRLEMENVRLSTEQRTMKENLERGTEKFDDMQRELKEIHGELKKIYGALAGSVWEGVGKPRGQAQ